MQDVYIESRRVSAAARAVAGNTWGANKKSLLTIYRSFICSVLNYGGTACNSASDNVTAYNVYE